MRARYRRALALAILCGTTAAIAGPPNEGVVDRYPFVGLEGSFGLQLTGVSFFGGYNFGHADLRLKVSTGGQLLPPGPGVGITVDGRYHVIDATHVRVGLGGELGVKLGTLIVPVAEALGVTELRTGLVGGYLQLKGGFPELVQATLGGKVTYQRFSAWVDGVAGIPSLLTVEGGLSLGF